MIFLQTIDPAQKTGEVAKQLASGNSEYLSELARKGVDLAIDGGKSILIAVVIFFVGKLLISFVNRMVDHMMQRRKIEPTIQTFLKSLLNVLMMILLGITVISALGVNTTSFAALLASAGCRGSVCSVTTRPLPVSYFRPASRPGDSPSRNTGC